MQLPGTSPAASLHEERTAAQTLLNLLRQEQVHLVDTDVNALSALTEEKARIAAHMSSLALKRHSMLSQAKFEASETGMQAWLNSAAATAADNEAWNALVTLVKEAKEQNRVNGLLIAQHMVRNQSALNILQGNSQGGTFYGPNGQSTTKIGSRGLVIG